MFRTLIAAASLFLIAAPSAYAHGHGHDDDDRRGDDCWSEGREVHPRRVEGHEWRELHEARERFYSRWHPRWEVRRFERWFAWRMDELRRDRY